MKGGSRKEGCLEPRISRQCQSSLVMTLEPHYLYTETKGVVFRLRMPPRDWTNIYEAELKTSNYNLADKQTRERGLVISVI